MAIALDTRPTRTRLDAVRVDAGSLAGLSALELGELLTAVDDRLEVLVDVDARARLARARMAAELELADRLTG